MPETNGRNGVWKTLALVFLSAVLSGGSALMLSASKTHDLASRLAVEESKSAAFERQLSRIEDKLDRLLVLTGERGP